MEKNVPEDATATSCRHKKASQQYSHQLTPVRLPLLKAMAGRKLRPNGQNSRFCFAKLSIPIIQYPCHGVCWRMQQ